jgi:signal transduction histidine kinase/CheY-like chemotaxis protein
MTVNAHRILNRALASIAGKPDQSIKLLADTACAELWGSLPRKPSALAILMRDERGVWQAGISGNVPEWSIFPIVSMYQDALCAGKSLHIVDHLAHNIRSLGTSIRRSVMAPCVGLTKIGITQEAGVWLGIEDSQVLDDILLSVISEFCRAFSEWIQDSYGILLSLRKVTALERNNVEREKALSLVVHDLKAPLSAIKWQIMSSVRRSAPDGRGSSEQISEEIGYMEGLLTTLVSKDRALIPSRSSGCSLKDLLMRVLDRFKIEGDRKGIRCVLVSDLSFPLQKVDTFILAGESALLLERAVSNLVGNAIKYTSRGVVKVVGALGDTEVIISVHDSGEGIPESVISGLRDESNRTESTVIDSHQGGWGIGLHSVISSIRALKGSTEFGRSTCGGTVVDLRLPRELFAERVHSAPSDIQTLDEKIRVLIVDDDTDQSLSLKRALATYGMECGAVHSVADAVEIIRSGTPSVVLCDSRMPDGGALALLEALERGPKTLRIAVVSGDASEECIYKCASKGAEAFFSKPIEVGQIATWIKSEMRTASIT